MCHGAALCVGVGVIGLRPGTDPAVCIEVTCLQEESLERGATDGHWNTFGSLENSIFGDGLITLSASVALGETRGEINVERTIDKCVYIRKGMRLSYRQTIN